MEVTQTSQAKDCQAEVKEAEKTLTGDKVGKAVTQKDTIEASEDAGSAGALDPLTSNDTVNEGVGASGDTNDRKSTAIVEGTTDTRNGNTESLKQIREWDEAD